MAIDIDLTLATKTSDTSSVRTSKLRVVKVSGRLLWGMMKMKRAIFTLNTL